jgi:hypothetical protein
VHQEREDRVTGSAPDFEDRLLAGIRLTARDQLGELERQPAAVLEKVLLVVLVKLVPVRRGLVVVLDRLSDGVGRVLV